MEDDWREKVDVDPEVTEFTTESSCWRTTVLGDAGNVKVFGTPSNHDNRDESNILSEFGWINLPPPPPSRGSSDGRRVHSHSEFNQIIDSDLAGTHITSNSSLIPPPAPPQTSSAAVASSTTIGVVGAAVAEVEAEQPQPMMPSSSSEDMPEKSTGSCDSFADRPPSETASKAKKKGQKRIRQPRFAFMTKTDVDHLEDGYRWRKYGQKAVKNSPFPRSYYRCTNSKCTVKKRVERSSEDPTIVITTYEGQHSHHTVGFPRSGLISHEGAFSSQLTPSSSQFYYPGVQFPQGSIGIRESFQVLGEGEQSHELPQPTGQIFTDEGLLGDMLPPGMRNS